MSFEDIKNNLKAAADVARHVRSPAELLKLAIPAAQRSKRILNAGEPGPDAPTGAGVALALRALRNELKHDAYIGAGVDYTRLADSELFKRLEHLSRALQLVHPEDLSEPAERLAFFINLYNVQVIHGVIALRIRRSVREFPAFFTIIAYQIGDDIFTPDDIEHGILRANAGHPSRDAPQFEPHDPRQRWVFERVDPRVHLTLVCVSRSCPPIALYTASELDAQLDRACEGAVNVGVRVDHEARVIHTSELFKWYAQDFGGQPGTLAFFLNHADPALASDLERAHAYTWRYEPYDWSLNAT